MSLDAESLRNYEHWRRQGLLNIKPHSLRFGEFPEGWDLIATLKRHVDTLPYQNIVDLGCGYGRLSPAFDSNKYLGLDINEAAIDAARKAHPLHRFSVVTYTDDYPPADIYLAYTVFLHIPDESLKEVVSKICRHARWVVIAEILGNGKLDSGQRCSFEPHAVYCRTKRQYEELLGAHDFSCWEEIRKRYYFYQEAEISILIFRRNDAPPLRLELPADLENPQLEFTGIYEDGWAEADFSVRLGRSPSSRSLRIQGMMPGIDSQISGNRLAILIEGQGERQLEVPLGPFDVSIPVETEVPQPRITAHCEFTQFLPPPDGRKISVLLKSFSLETLL